MKLNRLLINTGIAALMALLLTFSPNLIAGDFVPYKSKGVAGLVEEPDPGEYVCGADTGEATHLGKYESTLELLVWPLFDDGLNFVGLKFVGPTKIKAANGDLVESILDVNLDPLTFTITGTYTVTDGTGRWDGASGGGDVVGVVNADGTFSYETNGIISRPKSRK